MVQHIGIVACSAEGAALCYRTICIEGADLMGEYAHPEVTMHTYPFDKYMQYIRSEDWDGVADLMISSSEKLAAVGANFIICPDNTIHNAFDRVAEESPLPWLHIAHEVAIEAVRGGYSCLGILGTRYLMESRVYPSKLDPIGIKYLIPELGDRQRINEIIFNELVYGLFTDESRGYFVQVISRLKNQGCDAVILGCTEIPLLITDKDSPVPTLDSTRILARAALRRAARSISH